MENKKCVCCGELFAPKNKNQKFCNVNCKAKINRKLNTVEVTCSICGQTFQKYKPDAIKSSVHRCSAECSKQYRYNMTHKTIQCEICGLEFDVIKSSKQRFCGSKCQHEWQKTQIGELNSHYRKVDRKCTFCGKDIWVTPYKKNNKNIFCSVECRRTWYATVWSQTKEWKEESRIRATNILTSGKISKVDSAPQNIVNNLLEQMGINFISEYNCKYYSIDNAITHNNELFFIEIMGTFWHCDRRMYPTISYPQQEKRIKQDKAKNTYINNKYNKSILYLWEYDITNNIELCKHLIVCHINKNLNPSMHSSYYNKDSSANIQYMEMTIEESRNCIELKSTKHQSKKQLDKWITFNCETCGKETEQLITRYKLHSHHYCSLKCSSIGYHHNYKKTIY